MDNPSHMVASQSVQDNKKRAAAARTAHNDRQAKRICKAVCDTLLQRLPSAMISGTMSPSQWAGTPLADSSTSSDIRPWTPLNTQAIQFSSTRTESKFDWCNARCKWQLWSNSATSSSGQCWLHRKMFLCFQTAMSCSCFCCPSTSCNQQPANSTSCTG